MDIHANTSWVSVFQVLVWKKYARLPSIILIDCNVTSFKICRLRIPAGMAYAAVCKEFWAGRKCSQRKSRHVSDVPLPFAILIAHCQAAASLFDDCSTKKSRQVNLDTTDSHPDLSSWQPIGSLFVDGLHLPLTATPCVVDALDKAGVFEGGANTSTRKRQEVDCPSGADLVLSDSCLLGYFNDDGAGPSDATRTKIWSSIAANHPGSRWWCRPCRQSAAARLRRAECSPRGRGTFHALEPAAQFWMDSVRPLEGPRCTVFHGCCGMGRERFEVVDDARRARERHQFLKESCTKWQVELRLIDVVGRSYF